jgi:CRISPR-associated protein Cas2
MVVLVCYDVATVTSAGAKRLRTIADICEDHGIRVQYSVFECRLTPATWVLFRARLLRKFDPTEDSLRFYFLDRDAVARTEHHGAKTALDPTKPLIV